MRVPLLLLIACAAAPAAAQSTAALVHDINPGPAGTIPGELQEMGGWLYFWGNDGVHGRELWRTDGLTASLVADITPGTAGSSYASFAGQVGGRLYFVGNDGVHGNELWYTDGTSTRMVADIRPGSESSVFDRWFGVNGKRLYFPANDGVHGWEPWVAEGDSVRMIAELVPGPSPVISQIEWFTPVGPFVYFSAHTGATGLELWRTDGADVELFKDIEPGSASSYPRGLAVVGDRLYFSARTAAFGTEPWVADSAGAWLLHDVNPGPAHGGGGGFLAYGEHIYFGAVTDSSQGIWATDGETAWLVTDLDPDSYDHETDIVGTAAGLLFLSSREWPGPGPQARDRLYRYDGVSVVRLAEFVSPDDAPNALTEFAGHVFFKGDDTTYGDEMWEIVGDSVRLVADINPGPYGAVPGWVEPMTGRLYFWARDGVHGTELWAITPGTVDSGSDPPDPGMPAIGRVVPNPVRTTATVEFALGESAPATLEVFDTLGRRVSTSQLAALRAGPNALALDVSRLAPGPYVVRVRAAGGSATARLTVAPR